MVSRPRGQTVRNTVIFIVGVSGIVYEAVKEKADRPWLLAVFAAMIGLPAAAVGDDVLAAWLQIRKDRNGTDEDALP